MRVLITGAGGQLGFELGNGPAPAGLERVALGRAELDVTDAAAVGRALDEHRPGLVINAAAFTQVDAAESDPRAEAVNHAAPGRLGRACASRGIPVFHVSTDYVFDGARPEPYTEMDEPRPISAYGRGKLAGERELAAASPAHLILRTSWLFSSRGHNFVRTILRAARERESLRVVADQRGCPTPARGLATALLELAGRLTAGAQHRPPWGLYHFCGKPATSWHGFAEAIVGEARRQGLALAVREVVPIATADWPTPAKRPANSALDCARAERQLGLARPDWREALAGVVRELAS